MSKVYQKVCNLLAAGNFSDREIFDFVSMLQSSNPHEVVDYVSSIRRLLSSEIYGYEKAASFWEPPNNFSFSSEAENKIEHLLLEEAGLPKTLAIALLTQEIQKRFSLQVPNESRKGFSNWVKRLLTILPESELLHIATLIRNQYVHESNYDWRLK